MTWRLSERSVTLVSYELRCPVHSTALFDLTLAAPPICVVRVSLTPPVPSAVAVVAAKDHVAWILVEAEKFTDADLTRAGPLLATYCNYFDMILDQLSRTQPPPHTHTHTPRAV